MAEPSETPRYEYESPFEVRTATQRHCPRCGGVGKKKGVRCPDCGGTGKGKAVPGKQ